VAPQFTITETTAAPVAEICRRVDGLPLALELAAARIKILPPEALLARLEQRLALLADGARDAPDRQQTMRNTIGWSYDLLTAREQVLLRRLAIFSGGFTLEAAELVSRTVETSRRRDVAAASPSDTAILEVLASLVDQSLLRLGEVALSGTVEARFSMLETVREYALERLEASGEAEIVRHAHAAYYLALVERAEASLHGPDAPATLNRLEAEHDNLRAALAWTIEQEDAPIALKLAHASWRFWWMHSHLDHGRLWLERALALPDPGASAAALRPRALVDAGYFARIQGAYTDAFAMGEEALAASRTIGDIDTMASALFLLGLVASDRGELEQAQLYYQEALALDRKQGDRHAVAIYLNQLGEIAIAQDQLDEAATAGEEALAIWRERGDAWGIAWGLIQLGKLARAQGDAAHAVALLRQSLTSNAQLGDQEITTRAVSELALLASDRGRYDLAARLYGMVATLRETIGVPLAPIDRARYEQAVATARAGLDAAEFTAAWDAGRTLPLDHALAEALNASQEIG
jgi:tetratricopeptide (TPR) repeat protein